MYYITDVHYYDLKRISQTDDKLLSISNYTYMYYLHTLTNTYNIRLLFYILQNSHQNIVT